MICPKHKCCLKPLFSSMYCPECDAEVPAISKNDPEIPNPYSLDFTDEDWKSLGIDLDIPCGDPKK